MGLKTKTLTIMIVDIVGSTPMVEQSSRQQLMDMMEDVTLPIRQAVTEFGGTIVKFTGDGYLSVFDSASDALYASARIIDSFMGQPTLPTGQRLEGCRVVLHTGDAVLTDDDVIGECVVIPSRLEKHVPTNQVYLSGTVRDIAKSSEFEYELVGDFPLKGIANPVRVYRLRTEPLSGIERGSLLMLTDLLGMSQFMTTAPIDLVNRTLQHWISLQRQAIAGGNGRLRAIVGDNLMTTYVNADDAVHALMQLEKLVDEHNQNPGDLPSFSYSAVICKGDLFVLSVGVNGPLVSHTFRLMEAIQSGQKVVEKTVYEDLTLNQTAFSRYEHPEGRVYYFLGKAAEPVAK